MKFEEVCERDECTRSDPYSYVGPCESAQSCYYVRMCKLALTFLHVTCTARMCVPIPSTSANAHTQHHTHTHQLETCTKNCVSTCDENNPNDNVGLCPCYTYGPNTQLQDETDFYTLDGSSPQQHRDQKYFTT